MRRKGAADIGQGRGYIRPPGTSGLLALNGIGRMTGTTRSSEGLSDRRKRLLFRCWHRGMREMDLILGRFADAHIAELTEAELDELERLGEIPDPDLFAMLSGAAEIPPALAQGLLPRIKAYRAPDADA